MSEHYYISSNKYSLQERQTKRGKVYDVVFRIVTIDGTEKQKKLSGFSTKALAKQGYLEFVTEKCELVKNNPLKKKNPQKEEPTVGELIRAYMATLGNANKESGIYDKNNIFRLYILPYFNDVKMKDLTVERLYAWQDELWTKKNHRNGEYFSWKYLVKIRGRFNTFLNWVEKRYSYENYLSKVDKPRHTSSLKKEMLFWTRGEFEQFISVIDDPMWHAFFTFAFFTGRRKGELFALYKEDVNPTSITISKSINRRTFGKETWKIDSTKAGKVSVVPICKVVQDEIKSYTPKGKFYFGGEEPLAPTTVTRVFNKYIEQSGVKRIRIHDLRHSFVSMLIHNGANFIVVADLISDTVEQVIKTYGHMYQEDKISILSKII